ncbi:MAG TPA: hypothetical protein VFP69_13790 [Streptomyces sp.]|nr:hypothetical protein [Streptomyces sp.]
MRPWKRRAPAVAAVPLAAQAGPVVPAAHAGPVPAAGPHDDFTGGGTARRHTAHGSDACPSGAVRGARRGPSVAGRHTGEGPGHRVRSGNPALGTAGGRLRDIVAVRAAGPDARGGPGIAR